MSAPPPPLGLLLVLAAARAALALPAGLPPPPAGRAGAAVDALSRTLGRDASALFSVTLDAAAAPCVTVSGGGAAGAVAVRAATAVDAVYGAGQFLAQTLRASFAWCLTGGAQLANLPPVGQPLPAVPAGGLTYCRPAGARRRRQARSTG